MEIQTQNPLNFHQEKLKWFWRKHIGHYRSLKNTEFSMLGHDETIEDLKLLGCATLKMKIQSRSAFDRAKHRPDYQWKWCFACGVKAEIRHHIFWRSRGGRNSSINVVGLCRACHAEIHDWL